MSATASSPALALHVATESPHVFPYEILGEIFTHCDAPTLAAVSRASFACLELTSELLYTDITLSDAKSMAMLLRLESNGKTSETRLSKSARVTAHTSRSRIHSVTLHNEGVFNTYALEDEYMVGPAPPPLSIEVLAISVATADVHESEDSALPVVDISKVAVLFSPRIFILRGRRAPLPTPLPDISRLVESRPDNSAERPHPLWPDLAFFIQSGASLFPYDLRIFSTSPAEDDGPWPPRVPLVWDLLDIQTDPRREARQTWMVSTLFAYCRIVQGEGAMADQEARGRGWVGSHAIKDDLLSRYNDEFGVAGADTPPIVDIPSDRLRRLRDAFVEHGVRKDMDWAALDDL